MTRRRKDHKRPLDVEQNVALLRAVRMNVGCNINGTRSSETAARMYIILHLIEAIERTMHGEGLDKVEHELTAAKLEITCIRRNAIAPIVTVDVTTP